jgi:KRAB domain-containing zinc finger protein
MPSSVEPSVLSTGDTKYKEVKLQRSASMNADHCYIHAQQSLYCCMYCRKTVTSKDTLISHQVMAHHSKIFHCEQCNTVYYSKELLDKHQRSHFREPKHNTSVKNVESKEKFQTCTVDQLDHDLDGVLPLLKNLAPEESYTDKNILKLNGGEMEEIRVVDVHIAPEKVTQKRGVIKNYSRFHLKLSKEFENIDQNYKSKILETINKITEKNCDNTKIGTITTERTRKEIENELEKPKIAKPKMKMEKNVKKHKIWKCSHCNHVSTSQKQYREHHRTHPPVKLSCSYCDKQFPSQKSLSHHIYIHHTDEKHFICEFCGTSFRFWRSLRDHLFIHDKTESLFQCDRCGREFGSKASYDSHCSSHSEASYLCDVCGKSMKYFTSLWLHRLSHADPSNVPQHSCVICGKIYRSRYVHLLLFYQEHFPLRYCFHK